jgi:protein tyrosine phosphatase
MRLKLVENEEQYIFIHDFIKYCLENPEIIKPQK